MPQAHDLSLVELFLRFATIGQLALLAAVLLREFRDSWPGRTGALFAFGVASYLLCSAGFIPLLPIGVDVIVEIGCDGSTGFFWLFALALFIDGFRPRWHWIAPAVLIGIGLSVGTVAPHESQTATALILAHQTIEIVLVAHALVVVWLGHRQDLIEARRRFRVGFVIVVAGYILTIQGAELIFFHETAPAWLSLLNAAGILLVTSVLCVTAMRVGQSTLFAAPTSPARARRITAANVADRTALAKLRQLMAEEHVYRQPNLTIGVLATEVGLPEHQLRRLINGMLGYRNFSAFLNTYRLAEARERLADPAEARVPILTIAMDLGYGSIGPFNRAFKAETDMTPSAYREEALAGAPAARAGPSPISKK